jgi:chromosome segregation ATPase
MARFGVRPEQVFETADALVREGQNPTVMAVRTRLGGGSPNTITPLLAEWKALHEAGQVQAHPEVPGQIEALMRQIWGLAWKEARGLLEGEREALSAARKEIAKERDAMLAEIVRMDSELEASRETIRETGAALEEERRAHERAESEAREARALADEREKRIAAQEEELHELRRQIEALRIEAATLSERAAHADELRAVLKTLQEQKGRGEGTGRAKRRTKPEGQGAS